jgi:hypothetical protein
VCRICINTDLLRKLRTLAMCTHCTDMYRWLRGWCVWSHCALQMALKWDKNDYEVDRMDENRIGRDKGR